MNPLAKVFHFNLRRLSDACMTVSILCLVLLIRGDVTAAKECLSGSSNTEAGVVYCQLLSIAYWYQRADEKRDSATPL